MKLFEELKEMPEFRRISLLYIIGALLWICFIAILFQMSWSSGQLRSSVSAGGQIIGIASRVESGSPTQQMTPALIGEPLTVLTEIVNTLGLRERMVQLQSNVAGISLQFERIYGNELTEFLTTLDSRGLVIKNGEIKALPAGDERLLSVSLLLEQNR